MDWTRRIMVTYRFRTVMASFAWLTGWGLAGLYRVGVTPVLEMEFGRRYRWPAPALTEAILRYQPLTFVVVGGGGAIGLYLVNRVFLREDEESAARVFDTAAAIGGLLALLGCALSYVEWRTLSLAH